MAAFPFHYYMTLRDEYIAEMAVTPATPEDEEGVRDIDFDAEFLRGELT